MNLCQTGDRYVTLGTPKGGRPGIVEPGEMSERYPTEPAACAAALLAFDAYAEGRDGVLYWRSRPAMDIAAIGFRVKLRLVISDAPERWATVSDFIDQEIGRETTCIRRW